jgi:hypothetical protein
MTTRLSWKAVTPPDNTTITYSVFRSASEDFSPSPSNRIAKGLKKTSYVATEPSAKKDYYYYVTAVTTMVSAWPEPSQVDALPPTVQNTRCHALIVSFDQEMRVALGERMKGSQPTRPAEDFERFSTRVQSLVDESQQLLDCVSRAPQELSMDDWQKAVFLNGDLTQQLDDASASVESATHSQTARIYDQQLMKAYDDLVHKYNTLVDDYNSQRNLLIRLSASPLTLPPPPMPMHCNVFAFGTVGSIDCY